MTSQFGLILSDLLGYKNPNVGLTLKTTAQKRALHTHTMASQVGELPRVKAGTPSGVI